MKKKRTEKKEIGLGFFRVFLFCLIIAIIYLVLLFFDDSLYSLFSLDITASLHNFIFFIQEDWIFFPGILILGLFFIFIQKKNINKKEKKKKMLSFLVAFAFSLLISLILKQLIYKPRPDILFGTDGFPSGHATGLFSLLPFLDKNSKYLNMAYGFFILFIIITRFIFGYHHLSDLFFGAIVGYSISFLTKLVFKIKKWK